MSIQRLIFPHNNTPFSINGYIEDRDDMSHPFIIMFTSNNNVYIINIEFYIKASTLAVSEKEYEKYIKKLDYKKDFDKIFL